LDSSSSTCSDFAPSDEYQALAKPHLTSRKLLGTFLRGGAIGIAGILAGTLTRQGLRGPLFGLEVGFVVAAAGAIVATLSPFIEWWADRLPERRLGIFGATLVFAGFALRSLQYWAVLLNIPIR
jgi:MFS family permease